MGGAGGRFVTMMKPDRKCQRRQGAPVVVGRAIPLYLLLDFDVCTVYIGVAV